LQILDDCSLWWWHALYWRPCIL